jgi:YVTN family beta-propeller protein
MARRRSPPDSALAPLIVAAVLLAALTPLAGLGSASASPDLESGVVATIPIYSASLLGGVWYDPMNGELYVPALAALESNGTVSVISGANNSVIATVTVGWDPDSISLDPANGDVYVANFAPGCGNCGPGYWQALANVTVISGTNNTALASVRTGASPTDATYDTVNGEIYVPDDTLNAQDNGSITVISTANNTRVETFAVPAYPVWVLYNGATNDLYVMDQSPVDGGNDPNHITILSANSTEYVGGISLLGESTGPMFLDTSNGDWYAGGTDGLTVIASGSNSVVGTLSIGGLQSMFVGAQENVYMFQPGAPAHVYVISGTSNSVVSTFSVGNATDAGYDPADGDIYTTNGWPGFVNVTSVATHQLLQSIDLGTGYLLASDPLFDPGNGDVYLASSGGLNDVVVISGSVVPPSPPAPAIAPVNEWAWFAGGIGIGALVTAAVAAVLLRMSRRNSKSS